MFAIYTYPDNSALFRDVKRVGDRKVLSSHPGLKVVDVQQVGELRVLWIHRTYQTWLHVTEDSRDQSCLKIRFELMKSDVLAKFSGQWELYPIKDEAGVTVGCRGVFEQDVLPAGMPPFMQRIPVLGGLLRGISAKAITRLMEDSNVAVAKVVRGMASGKTVQQILIEICGTCKAEAGFSNSPVSSFQIDDVEEGEDEQDAACKGSSFSEPPCLAVHIEAKDGEPVKLHIILREETRGVAVGLQVLENHVHLSLKEAA